MGKFLARVERIAVVLGNAFVILSMLLFIVESADSFEELMRWNLP